MQIAAIFFSYYFTLNSGIKKNSFHHEVYPRSAPSLFLNYFETGSVSPISQTWNFTCTELNVNEDSFLFKLICIKFGTCEFRWNFVEISYVILHKSSLVWRIKGLQIYIQLSRHHSYVIAWIGLYTILPELVKIIYLYLLYSAE